MPSLADLAAGTRLSGADLDRLHRLLADWQLLADLSFADLVLWLPTDDGFVAAAQMRPTTGPTALHEDLVGTRLPRGRRPQLDRALAEARICRETDPDWPGDVPVREETIPVLRDGEVIAVVSRHTNLAAARTPSRLELTYLRSADDLALMVAQGRFPVPGESHRVALAPRVGDGLIRLDAQGVVTFASPNALSAYRRMGWVTDLAGLRLGDITSSLAGAAAGPGARPDPVDEALSLVVSGWVAREAELEVAGAVVRLRVIPLTPDGVRTGALVLCRDVTELRRREKELVGKDVTIREIHHRVKNNLQTVAALLRLQARRLDSSGEAGRLAAAALAEAQRRIGSIAVVHETLARTAEAGVDFDEVTDRLLAGLGEVGGRRAAVLREGEFGVLPPEVATPLALVLVELVQNAAEHAPGATLRIAVRRDGDSPGGSRMSVIVADTGPGLPEGFDPATGAGLGLEIVRTLVEGELGGALSVQSQPGQGTTFRLELPAA